MMTYYEKFTLLKNFGRNIIFMYPILILSLILDVSSKVSKGCLCN